MKRIKGQFPSCRDDHRASAAPVVETMECRLLMAGDGLSSTLMIGERLPQPSEAPKIVVEVDFGPRARGTQLASVTDLIIDPFNPN